ncbi:MAG: protein phosphatase 2C domain-containing protein [Zoogloeaceae bacterium]|jgi:hypothetical protein|nr:protein phosphatase 2C domain-containing protein [Zoogloeaceae bacterium]
MNEEQKRQHGEIYRRLIGGLFGKEEKVDIRLFDGSVIPTRVREFSESDAVQNAATVFVGELMQIWEERYKEPLHFATSAKARSEVKKLEFQNFDTPSANTPPPLLPSPERHASVTLSKPQTEPQTRSQPAAAASAAPHSAAPPKSVSPLKPGQIPTMTTPPTPIAPPPPPRFQLPNCKAGVDYAGKIECIDAPNIKVLSVDFPDPLGADLQFHRESQSIRGVTDDVGEFILHLDWRQGADATSRKGTCHFTVIADPRSLWQVHEPDPRLPYPKPHLDKALIRGNGFSIAAASRRGRSHEHGGSFRDDDFHIRDLPEIGWSVLIVADGAGSAAHSREGARLAVTTAGRCLETDLAGSTGTEITRLLGDWEMETQKKAIYDLAYRSFQNAAREAVAAITAEAEKTGRPVKSYATTLLAAMLRRENSGGVFLASFWMGDGAIAAYGPQGAVKLMGTPDSGEFAGQTRFLDAAALHDPEFYKRIRIDRFHNLHAVLLMTDGVSDPRFETDNGLNDPAKWDALWAELHPLLADEEADQKLLDWLHFFVPGHHDDRTLALEWFGDAP